MNERIRELAEQAFEIDLSLSVNSRVSVVIKVEHLERFAELVRQDEREACAKLCDEFDVPKKIDDANPYYLKGKRMAARQLSYAIRARGNT
jgi:hypothetical protein